MPTLHERHENDRGENLNCQKIVKQSSKNRQKIVKISSKKFVYKFINFGPGMPTLHECHENDRGENLRPSPFVQALCCWLINHVIYLKAENLI